MTDRERFAAEMATRLDAVAFRLRGWGLFLTQSDSELRAPLHEWLRALGEREFVLRYQLRQLCSARGAALDDLRAGLVLAWEGYCRDICSFARMFLKTIQETDTSHDDQKQSTGNDAAQHQGSYWIPDQRE